jgi:hypothetical protein
VRPREETIEFRAGRLPQNLTFVPYGKERVKEWDARPQKLPGDQNGFGLKAFSSESLIGMQAGSRPEACELRTLEAALIQSEQNRP